MYVNVDCARPHIGDGLKRMKLRIVYVMSERSLGYPAKPKNSAYALRGRGGQKTSGIPLAIEGKPVIALAG